MDELLDSYGDGLIDTAAVIEALTGNITDGSFPPPVSVLEGVEEYIDALTDDDHGLYWAQRRQDQDLLKDKDRRVRGLLTTLLTVAKQPPEKKATAAAFAEVRRAAERRALLFLSHPRLG